MNERFTLSFYVYIRRDYNMHPATLAKNIFTDIYKRRINAETITVDGITPTGDYIAFKKSTHDCSITSTKNAICNIIRTSIDYPYHIVRLIINRTRAIEVRNGLIYSRIEKINREYVESLLNT